MLPLSPMPLLLVLALRRLLAELGNPALTGILFKKIVELL
jgi:hypothetical protein